MPIISGSIGRCLFTAAFCLSQFDRYFLHRRFRVARTATVYVTLFTGFRFRTTIRWIGKWYQRWNCAIRCNAGEWTDLRTWNGELSEVRERWNVEWTFLIRVEFIPDRDIWKTVTSNVHRYSLDFLAIFSSKCCSTNDCHVKRHTFCMSKCLGVMILHPRKNVDRKLVFSASEAAMIFLQKGDAWGRIFGYLNWVAKVFPESTDYRELRESTERYNAYIRVNDRENRSTTSMIKSHAIVFCYTVIEHRRWTISIVRSKSWASFSRYVFQEDARNERRTRHIISM